MTLLDDRPTLGGMTVTQPPAPPHWAPGYAPPRPTPNRRMAVPVVIVGLIAVAALIVGIVGLTDRPSAQPAAVPTSAPAAPAFTDADRAAAKEKVCTTFSNVVQSIRTATNVADGPEPIATSVNARAAMATGALALTRSVSPATPPDVAKAANALADAYSNYLLTAFQGNSQQNDADHAAALNATDALRAVCG